MPPQDSAYEAATPREVPKPRKNPATRLYISKLCAGGTMAQMRNIPKQDAFYIRELVDKGGPVPNDYEELNAFFIRLGDLKRAEAENRTEINRELWQILGDAVSLQTMQGKVAIKAHGYAGDYEIIDKIYTKWVSSEPLLANWDHFFHSQAAPSAVRNRKQYFVELLKEAEEKYTNGCRVLSVGSGPGRDIFDFCSVNGAERINFNCVDMDANAIKYSKEICRKYSDLIAFHCQNIFRYKASESFNLVWAAGIFDYLDDRRFIFLLNHLRTMLSAGGRLIVGNFSTYNPSRDYMEAGDWYLFHRDEDELYSLAKESGVSEENISIKSEPERVNLFMHITA